MNARLENKVRDVVSAVKWRVPSSQLRAAMDLATEELKAKMIWAVKGKKWEYRDANTTPEVRIVA